MIKNGSHIAELYQKFFPEELAKDAPDYSDGWKLMGFYDRFARLVDARLFPVHEFSESDMAYEEPDYCLCHMQLCMIDNWLWANRGQFCDPDDLHIVEKLVVSALQHEPLLPDVDFRLPVGYKFRLPRLHRLCRSEKGMIARLGLVADAILGNTNNCWLDVSEEEYAMSEMPEWGEDQMRYLAREYAEAKFLNKGIKEFFIWCDSANKVERVKRLLRGAQISEKEEQERIRVRVAMLSRPLVETLGGVL
ncbi:MAG TPA: hypothetical protein VJZ77_11635, partial [Blastocatellia bacterium]|nr:hypothetical protein [Blastocatellia bacterium]